MKSNDDGETSANKPRRTKSQEVSSKFLSSPGSTPGRISSSNQGSSSPVCKKPMSLSLDTRRTLRGPEDVVPPQRLWPSATTISAPTQPGSKRLDTLADCLGNERLMDVMEKKKNGKKDMSLSSALWLNRQKSSTEFSRFESDVRRGIGGSGASSSPHKENHRPILGGSMRFTGNFLPGRKSSVSSSAASRTLAFESPKAPVSGRLSVDENALHRSSSCRISKPDAFLDFLDSGSESSDLSSCSNLSSLSRKSGREVSSRYMNHLSRPKRGDQEANNPKNDSQDHDSEKSKKFMIKGAIKRASSLTGYGSSKSQWAMSPGRTGSPTLSVENKSRPLSFSSTKPPTSPSKSKGVEKLLNMGLDLFKSKKSSPSSMSPLGSSNGGDHFHELRLLHNGLMQWRLANAKSELASKNITDQAEMSLLSAWESIGKLRHSVVKKKLQVEKERLEMKLNCIINSQMKPLEQWEDMERKYSSAISNTVESLHSVISRVPLENGARADPTTTYYAIRHASDLTSSIKSFLNGFTSSAENAVPLLSELAEVVSQEKILMEECLEHLRTISLLEIEERNLTCAILQLGCVPAIA